MHSKLSSPSSCPCMLGSVASSCPAPPPHLCIVGGVAELCHLDGDLGKLLSSVMQLPLNGATAPSALALH